MVVDTIGFTDRGWIDTEKGRPQTEELHVTERFRRRNVGAMELGITIDDPKAYTRPWTVEMPQRITLDTELIDEFCIENERSWQRMHAK